MKWWSKPGRQYGIYPVLAVLTLLAVGCSQEIPPDRLKEGTPFPPVVFETLDGLPVPLAGYRGKVVVLNVWATWCRSCRKELPSLDGLRKQLDHRRFAVIGLSVDDDPHRVREYLIERSVKLTSYIDRDMNIARQSLGITVYPDTFVIDPGGVLVRRFVGERT